MPETEQYTKVCEARFDEILVEVQTINKRLFKDNGCKSLQSKINENAVWCSVIKWFTITLSAGVMLGFVGLLFWAIRAAIEK